MPRPSRVAEQPLNWNRAGLPGGSAAAARSGLLEKTRVVRAEESARAGRKAGLAPGREDGKKCGCVPHFLPCPVKTKSLPILLAVLVCTAVLIAEEQRIGALRQSLAQVQKDSAAAQEQMNLDAAELKKLRERNAALASESEQLRAHLADAKAGVPEAAATAAGTGAGATASGAGAAKTDDKMGWMKGVAKMFKDPEMKKMMRTQQSMGVRMMYGDLAKELGLSTAEADKVIELLADRQMDASEKAMATMDDAEKDPAKLEQAGKDAQQVMTDYEAKLTAALGPEKKAKLDEFERGIGDRMALQQYQGSFAAAGQPLDDTQRAGLLQIMKEERMKTPAGPLDPGNKDMAAAMKAMQSGDALEKSLETQRQLQQRVFDRAHTVLTPDQMNAFETAQKAQLQMQEMGVKMGKAMFGGEKAK